jgi:hypothetical protein
VAKSLRHFVNLSSRAVSANPGYALAERVRSPNIDTVESDSDRVFSYSRPCFNSAVGVLDL